MNLKLLIDGIVRQTTVLIAQLSTSEGVRSPLAHVANQVFFELAREIEAQGIKQRVAADMFGMALRAYQKKMQRLTESQSAQDRTLWEAVLSFVGEGEVARDRIEGRFKHDGAREVAAVLNDLVRSGLVYATGSGEHAVYGITRDDVRYRVQQSATLEGLANVAWLCVFRGEAASADELCALLPADEVHVRAAIDELCASGRLKEIDGRLESANVVLPLGTEQGFEAAVLDHFRALCVAIATKVRAGLGARRDDRLGGSTFTFTVDAAHPLAAEVYELFRSSRERSQALWDRVSAYNQTHPPDERTATRVTFYLGQTIEEVPPEDGETLPITKTDSSEIEGSGT
jgi:hypothetical protein